MVSVSIALTPHSHLLSADAITCDLRLEQHTRRLRQIIRYLGDFHNCDVMWPEDVREDGLS
jgi:hypothetical protein